MEIIRVIIALSNENQLIIMKNLLVKNGFDIIYAASEPQECLRKARQLKPDLAVLDFEFPQYNGYEVARILSEDKICSTILIANEGQEVLINQYKEQWDFTCLIKPVNPNALINTIELIVKNSRRVRMLEKEISDLKDSLESRKLIDRAKAIIIKKHGISEDEAFRILQKQSMNKGVPMKEIAKLVILNNT